MTKPQIESEPTPPFPGQKLEKPGLEADMKMRPRYEALRYKAAGKLEGKIALVTGGDSGIGRAVAVLFAREGADVAITCLSAERIDAAETQRAVEAEGRRSITIEGDVRDAQFCRELIDRTIAQLGRIDILVSNAAYQNRRAAIEDLTDEEFDIIRRHTTIGAQLLSNGQSELVQLAETIALTHHERWDGNGYPSGLAGEDIPLPARIVSVTDVFDALVNERPYKPSWSVDEAVAEIETQKGRQFDPQVVEAFLPLAQRYGKVNGRPRQG